MKRNLKYLAFVTMVMVMSFLSACKKDFLGQIPDDALAIEDVFQKDDLTRAFLANVYSNIRSETDHSGENVPWEGLSDEMDVTYVNYPMFTMNTNWTKATTNYNYWDFYYKAIRNASYFIQNAVPENNKITDPALLTKWRAESRMLRAYFYFMLLRQYGPVVIMPEAPLAPDATIEEVSLSRSSYDECVNYIASEIDKAYPDLQEPKQDIPTGDYNRMNKGIALGVKSRLLLYAASPLFNGNKDYADFKNIDGKNLINQTYDQNKWKKAADAAKVVINLNVYSLYKEPLANTGGVYSPAISLKNVFLSNWNSESIFVKASDVAPYDQNGAPRPAGGWSSWGPTQSAVDSYFMANGLPPVTGYNTDGSPIINPASGYTEIGFTSTATPNYAAGASMMYVNREPRFYVAISFNQSKWINAAGGTQANPLVLNMFYGGTSGGYTGANWSKTGYSTRKLASPSTSLLSPVTISPRFEIKMRLAEIYLNYVEALNEYDPSNPDILTYLNMIRERAGIPQYGSGAGQILPPTDMRAAIRQERRVELAFENFRFFDTRRWKIAEQVENGPFYGMNATNGTTTADFQKRTVFETRVFTKKHYLWNILQSELNRDKNLVGNPWW
ncbi:RagB/SusD family nutrient uptake outer membrane protein [Pedobacter polaris]|uniref:RagB/SusD family nutrient uptake outer membrane protein n=1 Tax=Pedobacter polaris TaxID=2571273 RepID=A0A4U1CWS2_9SPHI|nr:RagB/SusD family nutrient uptake outer membrane protein [Pedobacter polaris]TKC12775.1 RagB/SusD family nutrient uptake outer membrane protein [Pedobacter polaris]